MGVNDTPLSQRERDELRQTVTAGASRMRRARVRRIRLLSGAAAVVLVAGVVTGVVVGALMPANSPVTTPSPTATPTPDRSPTRTPSPTPTAAPAPATARSLFDGDCGAMVGTDLVSDVFGVAMEVKPERWQSPQVSLAGGLGCVWWDGDSYMTPSLTVYAYPAMTDAAQLPFLCETSTHATSCRTAFVSNGVWISASAAGSGLTEDGMQRLVDEIDSSVSEGPAPRAAEHAAGWWTLPSCDELAAVATPEGTTRAVPSLALSEEAAGVVWAGIETATAPYATFCAWDVVVARGAGDGTPARDYATQASVEVVPGGGRYFDAIAASDGAEPIEVDGVERATLARDNARWEGYAPAFVVRDGSNLLVLRGGHFLRPEELAPLAAPYIAFLNSRTP